MSKIDDLTILLKMKDKSGPAFKSMSSKLKSLKDSGALLAIGFNVIKTGALAIGAAFTAAVANGAMLNNELTRMKNSIGTTAQEADELYKIIREGAPATNLDNLGEGILTLKEGFFDARAESGPLFDLIKDFGLDLDLSLEEPRDQLLEFLKAMRQIESPTIRAGAAVANFGGEDAKAIITITNDIEVLDQTIARLAGTAEDLPSFISAIQIQNMQDAKDASNLLGNAWDDLSTTAYSLVAPALTFLTTKLTDFIGWVDGGIKSLGEFLGIFDSKDVKLTGLDAANDQLNATNETIKEMVANRDRLLGNDNGLIPFAGSQRESRLNDSIANEIAYRDEVAATITKLKKQESDAAAVVEASERARKLAADTAAAKIAGQKIAEVTLKKFNSEMKKQEGRASELLLGVSSLDLEGLISKQDGLALIKDREYLRIMGLDLSESRKDSLVATLFDQMGTVTQAVQARIADKTPELTIFDGLAGLKAANDLQNNFTSKIFGDSSGDAEAAEIQKVTDAVDAMQSVMGSAASAIGTLAGEFAKTKGQARAFVALQETIAVVSAYSAATQALASIEAPTLLQKFAAYGSVLAQGLAGVAAIRSAGSSIGAGGSGAASTPTASTGPSGGTGTADGSTTSTTSARTLNLTIQGTSGFTADQIEEFVQELNDGEYTKIKLDRVA